MRQRGTFIAVVGPSGAGKDTLIDGALARRPDIAAARRIIAPPRPQLGEAFEPVSDAVFDSMLVSGAFCLHWAAHGHRYAIHRRIDHALDAGRHIIGNCSRTVVEDARARLAPVLVICITAPVAIRAERLAGRGREDVDAIRARLERAAPAMPEGDDVRIVENGTTPEAGIDAFLSVLPPSQTA